jgi:flagellar hook protein FlgE
LDVIANNIANVNTDGFKAQRATFADAFYQNLQGASGPDPAFGRAGRNPQQIGLGINLASIDNLMHQGIARRTDNALDVAIEGGGFFIVRDRGGANLFTRAGRIETDAHWNLHIGGNSLMGWSTTPDATVPGGHAIDRGLLVPLSLSGENQNMPSEPTTRINITGNLRTTQLSTRPGIGGEPMLYRMIPKTIYDSLGNPYVMQMRFTYHPSVSGAADSPHGYWTMEAVGGWYVDGADGWTEATAAQIAAGDAVRLVHAFLEGDRTQSPSLLAICFFGGIADSDAGARGPVSVDDFIGDAISSATIAFNSNGSLVGMGLVDSFYPENGGWHTPAPFLHSTGAGATGYRDWFAGNEFNFRIIPVSGVAPSATFGSTPHSSVSHYGTGVAPPTPPNPADSTIMNIGVLTVNFAELGQRGGENTTIRALTQDGGGPGTLMDISVGQDGTIMGRFSNGRDRLLGQVPLAFFTNPAGLERVGNSFWRTTANSGPFDGVGLIGQMIGGALEGSNVDLANEFTEMITTQRGFQAASRTITVSDEMLQELVNLRR